MNRLAVIRSVGAALFAVAALGVGFGFISTGEQPIVSDIRIEIEAPAGGAFLTDGMIRQVLTEQAIAAGMPLPSVSLAATERALEATGFVREAVASLDAQNRLTVRVAMRVPIARVMGRSGAAGYIARDGFWVPLSELVAVRCPLVRGYVAYRNDSLQVPRDQADRLLELLQHIDTDAFLRAQVAEVYVDAGGGVTLFPAIGDTELYLGRLTRLDEKLTALRTFYRQVAQRKGWDAYRRIDLSYAGQIVARRRQSEPQTALGADAS